MLCLSVSRSKRMANAIHLICRHDDKGWPENVRADPDTKLFESGFWDISVDDAQALTGGWLYLHETKGSLSYFGGRIECFAEVPRHDVVHTNRIALKFRPSPTGKEQRWRGHNHTRA